MVLEGSGLAQSLFGPKLFDKALNLSGRVQGMASADGDTRTGQELYRTAGWLNALGALGEDGTCVSRTCQSTLHIHF